VLATSIAETSLTIEGIRIVIDSGFSRVSVFDPASGLSKLKTVRVSLDSADQRAGRAGRLNSGVCYRMWSPADHARLAEHREPEILQADLASLVLDLAAWGIQNPSALSWISPPPQAAVDSASELLHRLGALANNKITPHGRELLKLPCHPRIAHMLIEAKTPELKQLATDIAAIIEERDPLGKDAGIDINLRIEALRRSRESKSPRRNFLRIEKVAGAYRRLLRVEPNNEAYDYFDAGLLIAYAYPERIAMARPGNNARFQLANGRYVTAGHTDDLAAEPWLAVALADLRDDTGKIFLASVLDPADLKNLVKETQTITWDTRKGGLIASADLRIGSIVLQSKPIKNPDREQIVSAITDAIKREGVSLLNFDEAFIRLQNRIRSLREWNPTENWPDVSTNTLLKVPEDWLVLYLDHVKKPEDFKKINLSEALLSFLSWDQQNALNKLAPERIVVPTGSKIMLEYTGNGDAPVLAVRLQELFGMAQTPTVNEGKIPVLLHLLSPGYKPVQVTSDLKSFWNNTYFEVKKELKRRYPKHAWPEDPWNAIPVAKGRSSKI
jgi:ATP-dependent helicase HrpB